ncbi:unnamed protein product [Periconia digitata]|uniref:Uncharacterized protein n=1 Tax=Periconia digitata TaxID=1303443 RepID=A0A9W4XM54_9PLEO|nr:unnamed protein product [Periconia digitata]
MCHISYDCYPLPNYISRDFSYLRVLRCDTTMRLELDSKKLRSSTPQGILEYFRNALEISSDEEVTDQLLHLIEIDSLSPRPFIHLWLKVSSSPGALWKCMQQRFSIITRITSIVRFGKRLQSSSWKVFWDGVGGVDGLVTLFSDFSEYEVRSACRAIAHSWRGGDVEVKSRCFKDLFHALQSPSPNQKILDERPLDKYYRTLLPACVEIEDKSTILSMGDREEKLFFRHNHIALKNRFLESIVGENPNRDEWLYPILSRYLLYTSSRWGPLEAMPFPLRILQAMATVKHPIFDYQTFMNSLAHPLLMRGIRQKASWALLQDIIVTSLSWIERHGHLDKLAWKCNSFVHLIAKCWYKKQDMFSQLFAKVIVDGNKDLSALSSRLGHIRSDLPFSLHYHQFRFGWQSLGYNADNPEHMREIFAQMRDYMVCSLDPEESSWLLNRLDAASLVETPSQSATQPRALPSRWCFTKSPKIDFDCGPDLLQVILLHRSGHQEAANELAQINIQERKKKAVSSSDSYFRGQHACAVLTFSKESGCLEIYMKEQIWARRFVRDPLVARQLWASTSRSEIAMLSGIPAKPFLTPELTVHDISRGVVSANRAIVDLFETVDMAKREPSYNAHAYSGIHCMPLNVILERMRRLPHLTEYCGFSDEQSRQGVESNTVTMLLSREEKLLAPVLSEKITRIGHKDPSILQFVDNWLKARDELWRTLRPVALPDFAELPRPFPQGLPIQVLIAPFTFRSAILETHMPFLASRVGEVIFADPQEAFQPFPVGDDEMMDRKVLVDHYHKALELYILMGSTTLEQKERAQRAWNYAIGPLSQARLSEAEAIRYWKNEFAQTKIDLKSPTVQPSVAEAWLVVPEVDNPCNIEEWGLHPPTKHIPSPTKVLKPLAYIDLVKMTSNTRLTSFPTIRSVSKTIIRVPGEQIKARGMLLLERIDQALREPSVMDGILLTSILFLDETGGTGERLLSKPFPGTNPATIRFPTLYLDGETLRDPLCTKEEAFSMLRRLIHYVPPSMIAKGANSALEQLNKTAANIDEHREWSSLLYRYLDLLKRSDRPALAAKLAIQYMKSSSDSSTWYWIALSHELLKRLSASDAQACILYFADAIFDKLEERTKIQAELLTGNNSRDSEVLDSSMKKQQQDPSPLLKVTTVKLLVNSLKDAAYVSTKCSLSVLTKVLAKFSHNDVQGAVVSSLLAMYGSKPLMAETDDNVLHALETVIPIATNLREREPISASEWKTAETTSTPPRLTAQLLSENDTPLLLSLLDFLKEKMGHVDSDKQKNYFTSIILPIHAGLKEQTERWIHIFMRQHGISGPYHIPYPPFNHDITQRIFRDASRHAPLSLLDDYVRYVHFNITPPEPIASLNKRLQPRKDKPLTPAAKFWLSHFGRGLNIVGTAITALITLLDKSYSHQPSAITPTHIQEQYVQLFVLTLDHDTEHLTYTRRFTDRLCSALDNPKSSFPASWGTRYKPILEAIIAHIEYARNSNNPSGSTSARILPTTFKLQMYMMRFAARYSDKLPIDRPASREEREAHCEAFAARVMRCTDAMPGTVYHEQFAQLQLVLKFLQGDDRFRVACYLGDIGWMMQVEWEIQDVLRVELAAGLARKVGEVESEELKNKVEWMIQSWKVCEREEIRALGMGAGKVNWGF